VRARNFAENLAIFSDFVIFQRIFREKTGRKPGFVLPSAIICDQHGRGGCIMSLSGLDDVDPLGGMPRNYAAHMIIAQPAIDNAREETRREMQGQMAAVYADNDKLLAFNEHNYQGWMKAKEQVAGYKASSEWWHSECDRMTKAYKKFYNLYSEYYDALETEKANSKHWHSEALRMEDASNRNYAAWQEAVAAWESQKNRADAAESQLAEKNTYVEKLEADLREAASQIKDHQEARMMKFNILLALMSALDAAPAQTKAAIMQQMLRQQQQQHPLEKLAGEFDAKIQGWGKQVEAAGAQGLIEAAVLEELFDPVRGKPRPSGRGRIARTP
jgi:hypothetical protein